MGLYSLCNVGQAEAPHNVHVERMFMPTKWGWRRVIRDFIHNNEEGQEVPTFSRTLEMMRSRQQYLAGMIGSSDVHRDWGNPPTR